MALPTRITRDQKMAFARYLREGASVREAADHAGVGYTWARENAHIYKSPIPGLPVDAIPPDDTLSAIHLDSHDRSLSTTPGGHTPLQPIPYTALSPVAADCLDDFGRWRYRYFGRMSSPWQENAARVCVSKLQTPVKEYGVVNCPPGSGKSTLFTHDIPAWLTCRSRSLRGFIGSSTQAIANSYTGRLRNTFSRNIPFEASAEDLALGLSVDAQATLIADYGQFNPNIPTPIGAPWSRSQFTVAQMGETLIGEKESTWTAFGRDTGFLGWRVNFVVWDDLVVRARLRNPDVIAEDRRWFQDEAITRLEPGGLFILQGQRLGPEELYRFALDMKGDALLFDEEELFELGIDPGDAQEKKFWHIVYKAHYTEVCSTHPERRTHRITAPPYDPDKEISDPTQGCLLDPVRLPYRELKEIQSRPDGNFNVVYQQEDSDPQDVLIPKFWLDGGVHEGVDYPGCYDRKRKIAEIPFLGPAFQGIRFSAVTIDPSPTNFWSIQWWLYVQPPEAERLMGFRYLLDHIRMPLGANDILDWSIDENRWVGLLEEWRIRAKRLGCPFRHLIVERNAAQRFMLQYDWFKRWKGLHSIELRPHDTGVNKSDEEFGIKATRSHFRHGRVRLPGHESAWVTTYPSMELGRAVHGGVQPFVHELTLWPDCITDDTVMAYWFFEWQLQYLVRSHEELKQIHPDIPGYLQQTPPDAFLQAATGFGMDIEAVAQMAMDDAQGNMY